MTTPTATNNRLILLSPLDHDPRKTLDEQALAQASHNSFPIVARRAARKDVAGVVAGGSIALLLGGMTFWSMNGHRVSNIPPLTVEQAKPVSVPVMSAPVPSFTTSPPQPMNIPAPAPAPVISAPVSDHGAGPVVVFDASVAPPAATQPEPGSAAGWSNASLKPSSVPGGNDNDQFATRIGNGSTEAATAQPLDNPATTVVQGTLIAAVLETAINTDLPGYVRAVVSRDVRSFDGSQVVIPRSSRLVGQYKSSLAAGQTRAYVIWSRLIRPDGASVTLASPAVEFSGTSGLDGKVDGHFMKRFGAAALLTVIGGLSAVGNPAVVLSGGQGAAGVAAQGNAQIPPTIRVAQGQPIRVFTARDLDFSTVQNDVAQP